MDRPPPALISAALAATIALAAVSPAVAQTLAVYGRLYPELIHARVSGSTPAGASGLSTLAGSPAPENATVVKLDPSNSRLGLRGEEPLGHGLRAFFQIEQRIMLDTGNAASTGLASRDTFVGLASDAWGLVRVGNMDTVYKSIGDTLSFLGVSSGNFVSNSNVLAKQGFGTSSAGSFHLRRANAVWYETPEWHGAQWLLQYSPDEARTAHRNAYLLSTGFKVEAAQLYLALAYELHNDTFGGSRNVRAGLSNTANVDARARDSSTRGTVQYRVGDFTVEGDLAYTRYRERGGAAGRFQSYQHWSWALSADAKLSDGWRAAAALDRSARGSCSLFGGVPCTTDGLEGTQLSLGAAYYLSKRTSLFGLYARLWNGRSAQYNNIDGFDVPVGADTQQIALGIQHSF